MTKDLILIKIGGVASQQLTAPILETLLGWQKAGKQLIIVHGGGFAINQLMEEHQVPVCKINGLRVTSQADMVLVEKALVDMVGKDLTQSLVAKGLPAQQFVDKLPQVVEADFLDQATYGYVGDVVQVYPQALVDSLENGQIPVIPCLGYTQSGEVLNINADYVATALAISLQAKQLILMTDVPGVMEDEQVLASLPLAGVTEKIAKGVITGGMIPKIESAVKTVEAGVGQVLIGDSLTSGTVIKE